jgi:hypothetical protein
MEGDAHSADFLIRLRARAKNGNAEVQRILVEDGLPNYPGQTGEQKTREYLLSGDVDPINWWEQAGPSKTDIGDTVSSITPTKAHSGE